MLEIISLAYARNSLAHVRVDFEETRLVRDVLGLGILAEGELVDRVLLYLEFERAVVFGEAGGRFEVEVCVWV